VVRARRRTIDLLLRRAGLISMSDRLAAALIVLAAIVLAVVVKFRSPSPWTDVLLVLAVLATGAVLLFTLLHT
jgi:hypothetical protein